MISLIIRALDAYIERDSLQSQLRACRVPFWPWDSAATLRKRIAATVERGTAEVETCAPAPLADRAAHMEHLRTRVRGMFCAKHGHGIFAGHAPR